MLSRQVFDSLHLGFCDLTGEHPGDAHAVVVNVEHDADGILLAPVKDGV
jgi:hypothetical protein